MSEEKQIPQHVAIIMDGNGRWAEMRGKERYEGHARGVDSIRVVVRAAVEQGVKFLTLYAFSTENWGRPADEVNMLMELFCSSVVNEIAELQKQGVKVMIIGDRERFSDKVRQHLALAEQQTANEDKLTLILAFNYSSRSEIVMAVRKIATQVEKGELKKENITEQTVSKALYTAEIPDPDIVIRTSGECRLSNFLMWQAAYAEFYFPDTLWPDFTEVDFREALQVYARRNRRFGLVK